jgi:hypothetical protein
MLILGFLYREGFEKKLKDVVKRFGVGAQH